MGLIDNLKYQFKNGNLSVKLIFINVGVFFALFLLKLLDIGTYEDVLSYLVLPDTFKDFIKMPWTLITYMFIHIDFFHLLVNMFMLYLVGRFFYKTYGDKEFRIFYFFGGISGGLLYIMMYDWFLAGNSSLLGASAAIYSVLFAMVSYYPNMPIRLFFIEKPVKLLYLAIIFLAIGFLLQPNNLGGNISHVGGALFGYFYMKLYSKGKGRLSLNFNLPKLFTSNKQQGNTPPRNDYDYNDLRAERRSKTDAILDKISRSGYTSLTNEEKEFLFKQGNHK